MQRMNRPDAVSVEVKARVNQRTERFRVGLGHVEDGEDGPELCIQLAAQPHEGRLYLSLREIHRLALRTDPELEEPRALTH